MKVIAAKKREFLPLMLQISENRITSKRLFLPTGEKQWTF